MIRTGIVLGLALLSATALSCQVNELCLNCATGDGGDTSGDGGDMGDGGLPIDSDDSTDGGDGGTCIPTGDEVCDGRDNDCNGTADDNLPDEGTPCDNQVGECSGATHHCNAGVPTCTKAPVPELCDNKDNDCNGLTDEGDPGGGARCGTDAGECVAGTNRCVNGAIDCVGDIGSVGGQPEMCNGLDDDCDSMFDEGLTNLGACGATTDTGECQIGHLECEGGGPVCKDSIGPQFEVCDALDQDCDGNPTNGYNLMTDPANCGMCNFICNLPNAVEGCAGGGCTITGCLGGFVNADGMLANGCEYSCTPTGPEVCDGRDNDCDTRTDENITLPPVATFCRTAGECATGTTVACNTVGGVTQIRCNYADPDVSDDANGNILSETVCDMKDNDCDGATDESQPNLGQSCNNGGTGVCAGTGVFVCPAGGTGPATCNITMPGQTASAEVCDGLDNNCNGTVDDGFATGNLTGQDWVAIPGGGGTQIQKYEASRPDARAGNPGALNTHVCSRVGVQPWTNITQPQAETACAAIGARLCTETEWQRMCDPQPTFPLAGPTGTTDFVYVEAEYAAANVTQGGKTWTVNNTQDFSGISALQALTDSNVTVNTAQALANAPRLDFTFTLAATTQYAVWVRMMGVADNGDAVHVGLVAGAAAGAPNAGTLVTNPDNVWTWVKSNNIASGAAGTHTVSVFMNEDGVRVDAIALVRATNTTTPTFDERTWAYSTNPKVAQLTTCNSDDLDTNGAMAGDQDDILNTGAQTQCFANGAGTADAFDMSGNVKEWTRERAPNQNPLRGGAANNEVSGTTCNINFSLADDQFFFPNVGFRCCR